MNQEKISSQGFKMENQQTQEIQQRQVAYKVPISSLLNNPYVEQSGWNPDYIKVSDKQVSRINLIATVIEKQVTESLATLTLDDSTGTLKARAFNQDIRKVHDINIGDPVLVIGKPRKFNESLFLNLEIIKKIDPLWTKVRQLELNKEFNLSENIPEVQNIPLNVYNEKILNLIKDKDLGDGADVNEIINSSGLNESNAQTTISELIKLGEIYEPKPNKLKILG